MGTVEGERRREKKKLKLIDDIKKGGYTKVRKGAMAQRDDDNDVNI